MNELIMVLFPSSYVSLHPEPDENAVEDVERSNFDSSRLFCDLFTCGLCGEMFNDEVILDL